MRNTLLKITQKITTWHEGMFKFLIKKSKTSMCLYEIFEHIVIPAVLLWWGFR
jgi:hypothetical protein